MQIIPKADVVPSLTELCICTIAQQIERKELLHFFDYLFDLGLMETAGQLCCQIIRMETSMFLQHAEFNDLNPRVLSWLLNQPSLNIRSEFDLFDACVQWAKTACGKAGLEASSTNVRTTLGQLVFLLRIPAMSRDDLVKAIKAGIFDQQEEQILLQHNTQDKVDKATMDTASRDFLSQFVNGFLRRNRPCTIVLDIPFCPYMN